MRNYNNRYFMYENLGSEHPIQIMPAPSNLFAKFEVTGEDGNPDGYCYDPVISIALRNNGDQVLHSLSSDGDIQELDITGSHKGIYQYDAINDQMIGLGHDWDGKGKKRIY